MTEFASVQWTRGVVRVLDQRLLPHQVVYRDLTDEVEVAEAIRDMVVRGAPLIGAVAAYGLALVAPAEPTARKVCDLACERLRLAAATDRG